MTSFTDNAEGLVPASTVPNDQSDDFHVLAGESPAMKALERATRDVASSRLPVLILGEPGTGKRALALRIHEWSSWSHLNLTEVECGELQSQEDWSFRQAALDSDQIDSESGTVLLHEVAALDAAGQGRLHELLLQHFGRPEQTAGTQPKMIFTSHRNLEHEVRLGRFREDLYYQISGICLRIPPLRHRKDDISLLADRFLAKYAMLLHRPKPALTEPTIRFLAEYSWPGNVRELEDAARTIAAIGDDKVAIAALRSAQRSTRRQNGKTPLVSLKEASRAASRAAEKELILKVLSRTQWNRKRAAEELKISYKALLYKLKQIGMNDPDSIAERELR